jgi:hypothetical protein
MACGKPSPTDSAEQEGDGCPQIVEIGGTDLEKEKEGKRLEEGMGVRRGMSKRVEEGHSLPALRASHQPFQGWPDCKA